MIKCFELINVCLKYIVIYKQEYTDIRESSLKHHLNVFQKIYMNIYIWYKYNVYLQDQL